MMSKLDYGQGCITFVFVHLFTRMETFDLCLLHPGKQLKIETKCYGHNQKRNFKTFVRFKKISFSFKYLF